MMDAKHVEAGLLALGGEQISGLPEIATLQQGDTIVVLVAEIDKGDESKEQWPKAQVITATGQTFALAGHRALMRALAKVPEQQWCLIECLGRPKGKQWVDYMVIHLSKADPGSTDDVKQHLGPLVEATDSLLEARCGEA